VAEFTWDADNPLARARGETAKANAALRDYVLMGAGRSLRSLMERYRAQFAHDPDTVPTIRWATLSRWSSHYDWQARLERFEDLETDRALVTWRQRQDEIREHEWDATEKLLARAEQMLRYPLTEQVVEDVQTDEEGLAYKRIVIVTPAGWSQTDIVRYLKLASDLGRRATQMEDGEGASLEIKIRSYGGIDLENDI
jgi:phosphoglycolate phosphatase-like HAD superfamily hydrolase